MHLGCKKKGLRDQVLLGPPLREPGPAPRHPALARRHGERSRLQVAFKLAGTVTAALDFLLGKFGCATVQKSFLVIP